MAGHSSNMFKLIKSLSKSSKAGYTSELLYLSQTLTLCLGLSGGLDHYQQFLRTPLPFLSALWFLGHRSWLMSGKGGLELILLYQTNQYHADCIICKTVFWT